MINVIVAVGKNNEIGGPDGLLWHLSSDLKRFKEITMGHPMIMGRKTFESIGRVLPGRTSLVISREASQRVSESEGLIWVESLEEALEKAKQLDDEVFVIGGGQIYAQALPYADRIYLTKVLADFPQADVFFPEIVGFEDFVPELTGEENELKWEYGVIGRLT
jgi:dihydrofolate reductase